MESLDDPVLVEHHGGTRAFVLNRPKQLNALSFKMIARLLDLFEEAERDDSVRLLLMKGNGRAFCAGGDVVSVVRNVGEANWRGGALFFHKEFTLNYMIATHGKPQVSIVDGIVMGGGAGVSVHGRFCVATENTVFSMPETSLGLFPDVGSSYFLPRLTGFFGEYLGLTGARLDGSEMLACGLATHFVPSHALISLENELINLDSSDPDAISDVISRFSQRPSLNAGSPYRRLDIIDMCFSLRTVEEILAALERNSGECEWVSQAITSLKIASPTSLKLTLRSIRKGRLEGIGQCLTREYRMVCHVLQANFSNDFFVGCRAMLVDKDRNPKWNPPRLDSVDDSMVDVFFSAISDGQWEDLKFLGRTTLFSYAIAKL